MQNNDNAHFGELTQAIISVLGQINTGQVIAPSLFDSLEQSLIQLISQRDEIRIDEQHTDTLAIAIYFIAQYRDVIQQS